MDDGTHRRDPAYARHALLPDDVAGVRFLYPDGSIPSGPDLAVDEVAYSPIGAQPGETITLLYTIANQGNLASGPFGVRLQLSGGPGPSLADPELDSWNEVSLGAGVNVTRGRELVLPMNLPPGTYQTVWEGRDQRGMTVASGLYFCVLQVGEFTAVKKMMMLK